MKKIDQLLEKYFDGTSSLEEEELLRRYFAGDSIEKRHLGYAPIFNYFQQERVSTTKVLPQKRKATPLLTLCKWAIPACILLTVIVRINIYYQEKEFSRSLLYIDGKKISDKEMMTSQAIYSLDNISYLDEETVSSQISVLDTFID